MLAALTRLEGLLNKRFSGKFANGAITAAFSYAFNEIVHYTVNNKDSSVTTRLTPEAGDPVENAKMLGGFAPGGDLAVCVMDDCSGFDWSLAAIRVIPGGGKLVGLGFDSFRAFKRFMGPAGDGVR